MIIGVSGKIGHGKDVLGARLVERHQFARLGFADALKSEVRRILNRTLLAYAEEHLGRPPIDGDIIRLLYDKRTPVTRALLQEWGTELRRADDADYWVNEWSRQVAALGAGRVVATDVRFINEARAIQEAGGRLILVVRPDHHQPDSVAGHTSETALDGWTEWDRILLNDGTVEGLWDKVDQVAEGWGL